MTQAETISASKLGLKDFKIFEAQKDSLGLTGAQKESLGSLEKNSLEYQCQNEFSAPYYSLMPMEP